MTVEAVTTPEALIAVLTWHEVAQAVREGGQRRVRRLAKGRTDRYGWDGRRDAWGSDIEAAASELAFAKATDRYWFPSPEPDYDGDVGTWQVRSTNRPDGCLIVYPADSDTARFVLVVGTIPTFQVVGWILGADAKRPEWAAGPRLRSPGYLVPRSALRPCERRPS